MLLIFPITSNGCAPQGCLYSFSFIVFLGLHHISGGEKGKPPLTPNLHLFIQEKVSCKVGGTISVWSLNRVLPVGLSACRRLSNLSGVLTPGPSRWSCITALH